MSSILPPTSVPTQKGQPSSSRLAATTDHSKSSPHQHQLNTHGADQRGGYKTGLGVSSSTHNPQNIAAGSSSREARQFTTHDNLMSFPALDADFSSTAFNLEQYPFDSTNQHTSFDELLTPEYSENQISEHTTPQELIWEQQFLSRDTAQPHILDSFQPHEFDANHAQLSSSNDLQGLLPSLDQQPPKFMTGSQLLSPEPTSPSSPEPASRSVSAALAATSIYNTKMSQSHKRSAEPLEIFTSQTTLSPQTTRTSHPGATSPIQRAVSPVVIVSSHNRGDSPARLSFPRPRSSSKRGNQSELQYNPGSHENGSPPRTSRPNATDDVNSHLMPPDPFEVDNFPGETAERSGLGPTQRGNEQVPTINELAEQRQIEEKNSEVVHWLATSETGSDAGDNPSRRSSRRGRKQNDRPRARSTGVIVDGLGLPVYSDKGIPGPGVLIDEDSAEEYSDNGSVTDEDAQSSDEGPESPPISTADIRAQDSDPSYFPRFDEDDIPPEVQEPLPRQFYRRTPWQDPPRAGIMTNTQDQPLTSNAAATRWNQEAARWETASRAATWGTRRRLSESEVNSIVEGSRVRHPSLAKRGRERGSSFLNKARSLIPRRSNSNIKKLTESPPPETSRELDVGPGHHRESITSISQQRKLSVGKSRSPQLDTGSAFIAMTGQLTAVGQATPVKTEPEGSKSPLQILRKYRSKSDVGKPSDKSSPGLAELMSSHGGPPMPTLASPLQDRQPLHIHQSMDDAAQDDDDDDDLMDEEGIKMEFNLVQAENIIPTYEGFKMHARQLNPRLAPYLIDRIGQEQIRRYKKLMENKVKHSRLVRESQKCPSGKFCVDLGGAPILLAPRVNARDPEAPCAQFQVANPTDEEIDDSEFTDGVVTPALFPPGIPLPPVKRLPAEFECSLCFKVKKFQKPSDWTKHVHEDIQPFSCTFSLCNDPKSFKRKADWVRHENERHRRLEFWKCNVQECNHVCYRKDNFVQHLVREHKKVEPKTKSRGSGSSKAKPPQGNSWQLSTREQEENEVWRLVEVCRHETMNKPRDEPCKFCGNVLNSWKKLSVHMGKHMEQLAMPILELVRMREVGPDTIVSPVEQGHQKPPTIPLNNTVGGMEHSLSPYAMSAHSAYQSSSAGQSPATMQVQMGHHQFSQGYYSPQGISTPIQGHVMHGESYGSRSYPPPSGYSSGGLSGPQQFMSINTQLGSPYSPTHISQTSMQPMQSSIPRSQPLERGYDEGMDPMSMGHVTTYHQPHDSMAYSGSSDANSYPHYVSPMLQHHNINHAMDQMQRMDLASQHMSGEYQFHGQQPGQGEQTYQY